MSPAPAAGDPVGQVDLHAARATFEEAADGTVGVEEEFALLHPETLDLAPRYEELAAAAQADPVLVDAVAGELIDAEIEIRSGRAADLGEALRAQRDRRRRLFALARDHGTALGATGTHPWADYREQRIIDTPHYRRREEGLQWVARRNVTFALHVHVGVHGPDRAVRVCDRLREVLPTLLAVSANSPYLDGVDSGLHSARTQAFTRTFPRCGIPDAFGSWAAWADYVGLLVATSSIVEWTQLWWSVRPAPTFGTVEVRIADAQSSAAESDALSALVVACVAQAARDEDEGRPLPARPGRELEENLWRAIRYGLDGALIDFDAGRERPAAAAVEGLLAWTAPVRAELGLEPALPERNGAQRQRELIAAGATMEEVYALSVRETEATYAQEVVA